MQIGMERVGVVGCGQMGSGIAEVCARHGLDVIAVDMHDAAVSNGRKQIESSLANAVRRGKLTADDQQRALASLSYSTELSALADRQLVIEAVTEAEEVKTGIFRALDEIVADGDAILASNTSSIPIISLAAATRRPGQVLGMHFFNPVPVLPLVELVSSLTTSQETTERAASFAKEILGKDVIRSRDRAGFIVNALLVPYLLSAVRMLESGFASAGDIDLGMVRGCAHPMGPLALADLIGLDTTMAIAESLYDEFKEPLYAPPPLLARMVAAGQLGRKSGQGFYPYELPG
jgi:3-hydroxybutyryl-CoA dehydrogenase